MVGFWGARAFSVPQYFEDCLFPFSDGGGSEEQSIYKSETQMSTLLLPHALTFTDLNLVYQSSLPAFQMEESLAKQSCSETPRSDRRV